MFVAVGDGARLVSYDGVNWTTYVSPPIINGYYTYTNGQSITTGPTPTPPGIVYGAGMFVAFGTSIEDNANYILKSTNGLTWTPIYTASNGVINAVFAAAYGNNTWVFISTNEIITASITSSNWNWTQFQPSFSPGSIAFGNGKFVISLYIGGSILSSSDGIVWQYDSSLPARVTDIAYGDGVFVVTGVINPFNGHSWTNLYEVFVSSNLMQWTTNVICGYFELTPSQIAFGGSQFIGNFGSDIWTSANAFDWTNRFYGGPTTCAYAYGEGTFVCGNGANGDIYQSGVFTSQSNSPATTLAISTYPGVTINGAAGAVYQIQSTTNLNSTWQPLTNFMIPFSPYIWVDTSSPAVGKKFYRSVQLQ